MTFQELAPYAKDTRALMDYLRRKTYELSTNADLELAYGYEFEDKYKPQSAVTIPINRNHLETFDNC